MPSRPLSLVILIFWLSTMSWLVVAKVLPPLRTGEPPNYRTILPTGEVDEPVCWTISMNDKMLGWAASMVDRRKDGMAQMNSRVFLSELPIEDIAPGWLGAVVRPMLNSSGPLDMEAAGRLDIDPLGRLSAFETRMRVARIREALAIRGEIDGATLKVVVESGTFSWKSERYLSPQALVGDALSPQARLPGLWVGQKWWMPVYSPFRPPRSPIEILEARVEKTEGVRYDGRAIKAHLVVYRPDSGAGTGQSRETRGKLWVAPDGSVIRQEIMLLSSRLQFDRLPKAKGRVLLASLPTDWSQQMPRRRAHRLLSRLIEAQAK